MKTIKILGVACLCALAIGPVSAQWWQKNLETLPQKKGYIPGSFCFHDYKSALMGKKVGLVVNHTSGFKGIDLIDTLIRQGVQVEKIFAPEHGFRGKAEAGQYLSNGRDEKTGIEVISLYGKNKKPSPENLSNLDVLIFDIQDVGARFYTYISTLKLVMEACAENNKVLIVCDRANPLGFCVSGPILESSYTSFVGAFPVPVVHGLTVGELARMAVAKNWFSQARKLKLQIVKCRGYRHADTLFPEKAPSPNLRTPLSILAYPSLCLFEGTSVSVGRGTAFPFEVFGCPDSAFGPFSFVPEQKTDGSPPPLFAGQTCYGFRLNMDSVRSCFDTRFVRIAYQRSAHKELFFNAFFSKLAGNETLMKDVKSGRPYKESLGPYMKERKKYLLYP